MDDRISSKERMTEINRNMPRYKNKNEITRKKISKNNTGKKMEKEERKDK